MKSHCNISVTQSGKMCVCVSVAVYLYTFSCIMCISSKACRQACAFCCAGRAYCSGQLLLKSLKQFTVIMLSLLSCCSKVSLGFCFLRVVRTTALLLLFLVVFLYSNGGCCFKESVCLATLGCRIASCDLGSAGCSGFVM